MHPSNKGFLRRRLKEKPILVVPAAYDMVSAKLIEEVGFEAVYLSGYGQAASHLGMPDAGLMSFPEVLERVRHMVNAVKIPVIADADTGYGGVLNVRRTVREFEQAGAAAIQLEDQEWPKKCGHTPGRKVIGAEEMAAKIEAAVEARQSDDLLIIARTDARGVIGLDEAIRRGRLYEKAGADLLFIESPQTVEELKIVGQSFRVPLMANMVDGGLTPLLPAKALEALGFKMVAYAVTLLLAAAHAVREVLRHLKVTSSTEGLTGRLMPFQEFDRLIGFPEVREFERRYHQRMRDIGEEI
ncbi:MAG: isocitrate lyase/PEP mutase family protein [candidate division NC10 bacterium]|nr:isocitrate lyase/PEP mutase family protein [candidate division NC10 bacterium]